MEAPPRKGKCCSCQGVEPVEPPLLLVSRHGYPPLVMHTARLHGQRLYGSEGSANGDGGNLCFYLLQNGPDLTTMTDPSFDGRALFDPRAPTLCRTPRTLSGAGNASASEKCVLDTLWSIWVEAGDVCYVRSR